MTTFEFFKGLYDKNHDYFISRINSEIPVDSFKFVHTVWQNFWGGTTEVDSMYNIIGVSDTKEMLDKGYLKKWNDNSWKAKKLGTSRHVSLTAKGLRTFYNTVFK